MTFSTFEERIGYRFAAPDLLEEALRHGSAPRDEEGKRSYERLEFLGDAVLNLCVAQEMYRMLPLAGRACSPRRAPRSSTTGTLRGRGTDRRPGVAADRPFRPSEGGRGHPEDGGDAVEAVIGAIFLDGGHEAALRFVRGAISGFRT